MQDPRHPETPYEPKYPFNRVTVTESGHEFHVDDTPGKERIRQAHMSGTYTEVGPDGRQTNMVVGHQINYVKGGITVSADKNHDVKIGGSERKNVDGDSHAEVAGTSSSAVGGDQISIVGGDLTSAIRGDATTGITGGMTLKVGGGVNIKVDGGGSLAFDGPVTIESGGSITLRVGGTEIIISGGGVQVNGPRLRHNSKNVGDSHRHTEVQKGGAISGIPTS